MKRLLPGLFLVAALSRGERLTLPLDGLWQIEESVSPDDLPATFRRQAPVPGLANLAIPPFPDVDQFDSRELIRNRVRRKQLPESALITAVGIPRQNRNYFWYQRAFRAPARKQVAILRVNKAQFGTAVWLNGKKIGEHHGCFTAGWFDLTAALDWTGENRLLVRIGAHPAAVPASVPTGTDNEKLKWTPGIYDSVALLLSDNPVIASVQVAPRLDDSAILVETRVKNHGSAAASFRLGHQVRGWKAPPPRSLQLGPGEERAFNDTLPLPGARLWTPETPVLYTLQTTTGGDSLSTRFGMREFRFDTATRRAYLNGKVYFLRGSNITLHRFFEDPQTGALPWNEQWVRRLLVDIPKRMHWNSFRFCIGPVPDRWLQIADEAGLLIQNEFFIWGYHPEWDTAEVITQFQEWMRDNWNHPSVAIWDASNETASDLLRDTVIPAVRKLDLSNRPWDNGYSLPSGPDDPVEDHPYLFSRPFRIPDLETMAHFRQSASPHPTAHASILNEYDWLWLNRDGTPTLLTQEVYDRLVGPQATPEQRLALNAYLLAGLTEFWRARRYHAAILHFVYLTASFPGVYTSDHFRNLQTLELEPHFEDYVGQAFRPLGVYLNFWRESLPAGSEQRFAVVVTNDAPESARGTLEVSLGDARADVAFEVPSLGQQTYLVPLRIPAATGERLLEATAAGTRSRRRVTITAAAR